MMHRSIHSHRRYLLVIVGAALALAGCQPEIGRAHV